MEKPPFQFGLKAIFALMTGAAVILAVVHYVPPMILAIAATFFLIVVFFVVVQVVAFIFAGDLSDSRHSGLYRRVARRQPPDAPLPRPKV
jgi:membrane protein implicated in regulation of membrane protease activity